MMAKRSPRSVMRTREFTWQVQPYEPKANTVLRWILVVILCLLVVLTGFALAVLLGQDPGGLVVP